MAAAPATTMDRARAEKIIVDWRTRANAWREMKDAEALKNFDLVRVTGTDRHSAVSLSQLISEHSYARNTATSSHRLQSARERWSRGFAVNISAVGRGSMLERFLEHYMAMIDHDFFSGLLTRPVCGADNVFMATDAIVKIEVIDKAGPLSLSHAGRIIPPSGACFDPRRKVLTIRLMMYNLPEADLNRDWTTVEFMRTNFTGYIQRRSLDDIIVSMVQAMLHMYLRIGSCYRKDDAEERMRELQDPHGYGHGTAFWDSFAFISRHLSEWKMGSPELTFSAAHGQQQAVYWREHWSRHDELAQLGVDDAFGVRQSGVVGRMILKLLRIITWTLLSLSFGYLALTLCVKLRVKCIDFDPDVESGRPSMRFCSLIPLYHNLDQIIRMPVPSVAIFLFLWTQICMLFRLERQILALSIVQHVLLGLGLLAMFIYSRFGAPGFHALSYYQSVAFCIVALILHGNLLLGRRAAVVEGYDDWYDLFKMFLLGRWEYEN